MKNDEWGDLASQWAAVDVPDHAALQLRLGRYRRWNRLGLIGEILGAVTALVMAAWAWKDAADLRPWLLAASVAVVVWQAGYLLIRQRYRLFGAPAGGLVGMIDAETRRAKFVMASLWFGLGGGLLLIPLAQLTIPSVYHHELRTGLLLAAAGYIPYVALRTWQMMRRIKRLRSERVRLAG